MKNHVIALSLYALVAPHSAWTMEEQKAQGKVYLMPRPTYSYHTPLIEEDYKAIHENVEKQWQEVVIPLGQKFFEQKITRNEKKLDRIAAKLEQLAVETESSLFPTKTVAIAFVTASTLAPLLYPERVPHRSISTLFGVASFLKEQGINIAAVISISVLANKFVKWLHAPCKAEKDQLLEAFKKIVTEAASQSKKDFTELRQDVMREVEQGRMNGIDALIKVDDLSRGFEKRLTTLEKLLDKTDFKKELAPLKHELEKQQKNIDKLRKQKDPLKQDVAKIHHEINTLQKQCHEALSNPNGASTSGGFSNEAISILSQQIQKALEKQRLLEVMLQQQGFTPATTPSQSRCSSPSTSHTNTLKIPSQVAPSPSSRTISAPRRKSIPGTVTLEIIKEQLSASNSDASDNESDKSTPSSQSSHRRRRSFCFGSGSPHDTLA